MTRTKWLLFGLSTLTLLCLTLAEVGGFLNSSQTLWQPVYADCSPSKQPSVLVLLAHPDDEIFFSGTLAQLEEAGKTVQVVYTTAGEAGRDVTSHNRTSWTLGKERMQEARRALRHLGLKRRPIFLGFTDGKTLEQRSDILKKVSRLLEQHQPSLVFSFHPEDGITGHPDHKLIGEVAQTLVNERCSNIPISLYQALLTPQAHQTFLGCFPPGDPSWKSLRYNHAPSETLQKVPMAPQRIQQKIMALQAHRTQMPASDVRGFNCFYTQHLQEDFACCCHSCCRNVCSRLMP